MTEEIAIGTEAPLPPWPDLPEGFDFDPTSIVPRRTSTLFIGAIVFVRTEDYRVYRRTWNGKYYAAVGGPLARYRFRPRKIAGETRVSWLLNAYNWSTLDHAEKVPKRDLSTIYGRDDGEDVLWCGENQRKIADAVNKLAAGRKTRTQLEAIAQMVGVEV